jgi:hypothetical protein
MLVKLLDGKYKLACFGLAIDHCVNGIDDYRGVDLEKTTNLLRSSKILIGSAGGGVALGQLCGIYTITWFLENHRKNFEVYMNPLNNKCLYIPTFHMNIQPDPTFIFKIIEKHFNEQTKL